MVFSIMFAFESTVPLVGAVEGLGAAGIGVGTAIGATFTGAGVFIIGVVDDMLPIPGTKRLWCVRQEEVDAAIC